MKAPYVYRCRVLNVVDGDTCDVTVDVGFKVATAQRIRLLGINAPEMKLATRAAGQAAKDMLMLLLSRGDVWIRTEKDPDNFGRYLGEFTVTREDGSELNVNQAMIDEGHAVVYRK